MEMCGSRQAWRRRLSPHDDNLSLSQRGYSIRHIETWHEQDNQTFIHWDAPKLTEAELPY
jgi:hypothetical protein